MTEWVCSLAVFVLKCGSVAGGSFDASTLGSDVSITAPRAAFTFGKNTVPVGPFGELKYRLAVGDSDLFECAASWPYVHRLVPPIRVMPRLGTTESRRAAFTESDSSGKHAPLENPRATRRQRRPPPSYVSASRTRQASTRSASQTAPMEHPIARENPPLSPARGAVQCARHAPEVAGSGVAGVCALGGNNGLRQMH
ncbi:hypothetical protein WOLCODRAFT_21080 [Wolfiporia cocos MD-104 SS10]|uniref:Uncharacterized protein n=1 Tax=Wolfiporia cocos (strain MD-104) TaxID=742152 RepID=A0A2H3JFE6_WOLCO|nr:hypothetical protein WOLCODRAFT_21080 [Wolfiporia cocos MD-104 SS10]